MQPILMKDDKIGNLKYIINDIVTDENGSDPYKDVNQHFNNENVTEEEIEKIINTERELKDSINIFQEENSKYLSTTHKVPIIHEKQIDIIDKPADKPIPDLNNKKSSNKTRIQLELEILPDELEAYLNIITEEAGITVSKKDIIKFIKNEGIKYGFIEANLNRINDLLKEQKEITKYPVAKGKPPEKGENSRLVFKVENDPELAKEYILEQAKKRSIDLPDKESREKFIENYINQNNLFVAKIKKGEITAQKLLPEDGKNGTTVTGKTIDALKGDTINITVKRNIKFNSFENIYIPMIDGLLIYDKNTILCKIYKEGDFNIDISDDKMSAVLTILPSVGGAVPADCETIFNKIFEKDLNLFEYIDENFIMQKVKEVEQEHKVGQFEIGKGIEPVHGKDAYIKYAAKISEDEKFTEDKTGRIDYKNRSIIIHVKKGEMIAILFKAQKAVQDGKTILNKIIPAKDGKEKKIEPGQNVVIKEYDDRIEFYSEIEGHFKENYGTINVLPVFTVEGDLDFSVGNIDFHGDVIIMGNVLDGFSIKAAGDILIYGSVGNSFIKSDKDIVINNGFLGKGKGRIICKGSLNVKFIENGNVECNKSIIIKRGIINSIVKSNESIIINNKKGYIMGGELYAGTKIVTHVIGSRTGIKTKLFLGYNFQIKELISLIKKEKEKIQFDLSRIETVIQKLFKQKKEIKDFNNEMKKIYVESIKKKIILLQKIKDIQKKEKDYQENHIKELIVNNKPEIYAYNTIHSDVMIHLLDKTSIISDPIYKTKLSIDDPSGNILTRSL